jgi:hypothetical protein
MFSSKKENSSQPIVSPRKMIAPKQFSKYIQQAHHIQIDVLETKEADAAKQKTSFTSPRKTSSSPKIALSPAATVRTMDILFPEQKGIVAKLSTPKTPTKVMNSPTVSSSTISPKKEIRRRSISSTASFNQTRKRESVEELENMLIQQMKVLTKLQADADQVNT